MTTDTVCTTAEEVIERWKEAMLAGDADAAAALYEEDALFYVPGFGVRAEGRPAIREAIAGLLTQTDFQGMDVPSDPLVISGDYAFVHRVFQVTLKDRESGEVTTADMPATEIFHRGADGGWRYTVDHA